MSGELLRGLIKVADNLDSIGMSKQASTLDQIISKVAQQELENIIQLKPGKAYCSGKPFKWMKRKFDSPEERERFNALIDSGGEDEDVLGPTDDDREQWLEEESNSDVKGVVPFDR